MIDKSPRPIPDVTLETLAKSFFRDALYYGFRKLDYLRFVNRLLGVMMNNAAKLDGCIEIKAAVDRLKFPSHVTQLPIDGHEVTLTKLEYKKSFDELHRWIPDGVIRRGLRSTVMVNQTPNYTSGELGHTKIAAVITRHNDQPIGVISYIDHDSIHRKAELLVYFDEDEEEKKAVKKEAIMLWLAFGIKVLGLRKIYTNILSTDRNTITMNEEIGFRVEGILQNEVIYENQYHDIFRMGLFATESDYQADNVCMKNA